jgi:hypothetical protein
MVGWRFTCLSMFRAFAVLCFLLSLAACGGGGGGGGGGTSSTPPGNNPGNNPPPGGGSPPAAIAPTISAQPHSVTVDDGTIAAFSVTASGAAPLQYQWRRGSQDIAGATSPSFSMATTMADNGAQFTVAVTNSMGGVVSSVAMLSVTPVAPAITVQPQARSVLSGGSATFTVTATGTAPLLFQWRLNGVPIPGATSASVLTPIVFDAASGWVYDVVISNSAGTTTSAGAVLTVTPVPQAPFVTVAPQAVTTPSGSGATFTVTVTGTEPLSYQWRRNGTPIPGATNPSLILSGLTSADNGGAYSVVISNAVTTVTSAAAILHVVTTQDGIALAAGGLGVSAFVDGIGSTARFRILGGIASDASGFLYVVDKTFADPRIRRIAPNGQVTTLVGYTSSLLAGPEALVLNPAATTVYLADNSSVTAITPGGFVEIAGVLSFCSFADGVGTAGRFCQPQGIARDASGDLFVADTGNHAIRRVTLAGATTTIAGDPTQPGGYVDATGGAARFNRPEGIAIDGSGVLYVADAQNHVIRKITPAGAVSTFAGTAGQRGLVDANGTAARFDSPHSLALDPLGNVYVADSGNHAVRKISASGDVSTIAGTPGVTGVALGPLPGALNNPRGITVLSQSPAQTVLGVTDAGENVVLIIRVP